jgi:hypothetical protein
MTPDGWRLEKSESLECESGSRRWRRKRRGVRLPPSVGTSLRMEKGQVNLVTIVIAVLVVLGVIFLLTRL